MPNVNRPRSNRFQKGVSGNPGGRPKGNPEVKEILKAASPDAARALVELLNSDKDSIRLAAAQDILDRTQGKAIQAQDISMDVRGLLDLRGQIRAVFMEQMNGQSGNTSTIGDGT